MRINVVLFYREKTPPRPQGQRPEPENRGVGTQSINSSLSFHLCGAGSREQVLSIFLLWSGRMADFVPKLYDLFFFFPFYNTL